MRLGASLLFISLVGLPLGLACGDKDDSGGTTTADGGSSTDGGSSADGGGTDCADEDLVAWYRDYDADGYGRNNQYRYDCEQPAGYVDQGGDCSDTDPTRYPGAPEACDDIDSDCDGVADCGEDVCSDLPECQEGDFCDDGVDNDADGLTDCADDACAAEEHCIEANYCDDGVDNDVDELTDCKDEDCAGDPACASTDGGAADGGATDGGATDGGSADGGGYVGKPD